MRRNFRLMAVVVLVTTTFFGAFAQEETHKDVVLDGKPAKLNLKTGEVKKVKNKDLGSKNSEQDSTKFKTEIQANLITNTSLSKPKQPDNVIVTSMPDTLTQYYKQLLRNDDGRLPNLTSKGSDTTNTKQMVMDDVILITPENTEEETTTDDSSSKSHVINKTYYSSTGNFHIVQKGETLYSLSKLYNTTLGQLKQANGLETTLIKIGQKLQIRNFDEIDNSGVWVVSKGDTLYSIAKKNNTTVSSLKSLNGLTGDLIFPGQKLQF